MRLMGYISYVFLIVYIICRPRMSYVPYSVANIHGYEHSVYDTFVIQLFWCDTLPRYYINRSLSFCRLISEILSKQSIAGQTLKRVDPCVWVNADDLAMLGLINEGFNKMADIMQMKFSKSLKFAPLGPINSKASLLQERGFCFFSNKLPEPVRNDKVKPRISGMRLSRNWPHYPMDFDGNRFLSPFVYLDVR